MKRLALAALLIAVLGGSWWLQRGERTETATVDVSPPEIDTRELFKQRDLVPIESGPGDPGQARQEVEPEAVAPESGGPLSAADGPPTRTAPGEHERVQQELIGKNKL